MPYKNPEQRRIHDRNYRQRHKSHFLKQEKEWRNTHPKSIKLKAKKYSISEKGKLNWHRYEARHKSSTFHPTGETNQIRRCSFGRDHILLSNMLHSFQD